MALSAILRETSGDVVGDTSGVCSAVVIIYMATITVGGQRSLVVIRMAGSARDGGVRASEREARGAVVESGIQPSGGGVTECAVLREICCYMIGGTSDRRCTVEILSMASVTIGGQRSGEIIRMTGIACDGRVCAGKCESSLVVVEQCRRPTCRGMALVASSWKTAGNVVRICGRLKILGVAAVAKGRRVLVLIVHMAQIAGHCGVQACECVSRELQVVEAGIGPGVRRVAGFAIR